MNYFQDDRNVMPLDKAPAGEVMEVLSSTLSEDCKIIEHMLQLDIEHIYRIRIPNRDRLRNLKVGQFVKVVDEDGKKKIFKV